MIKDQVDYKCDNWQTIAMNFCGRSVTAPSDKLPALSGMAQRYARLIG